MNDIQYAVPDAKLKLFADDRPTDLLLYYSDPINLSAAANNYSMSQLSEWFTVNHLKITLISVLVKPVTGATEYNMKTT